jgi:hypothetical protein
LIKPRLCYDSGQNPFNRDEFYGIRYRVAGGALFRLPGAAVRDDKRPEFHQSAAVEFGNAKFGDAVPDGIDIYATVVGSEDANKISAPQSQTIRSTSQLRYRFNWKKRRNF